MQVGPPVSMCPAGSPQSVRTVLNFQRVHRFFLRTGLPRTAGRLGWLRHSTCKGLVVRASGVVENWHKLLIGKG